MWHVIYDDGDEEDLDAEEVAAAYGEVSDGGNSTQNVTNHWAEMFQVETPADMHLVVEFQCLHRLPETMALVFTIHKYIDPLSALAQTPEAADMMTRSWAAKSEEQMEYGPLDYRTAARTLFLRPYLAHFCSFFRRFFAVLSVLTPGFQKVVPKDRGRFRNGRKRPSKEWSPPTYS